jgi:hypothetical protein
MDNVIDLTNQTASGLNIEEAEPAKVADNICSTVELEKKRAIMMRAFALTSGQLEHDALKLEEQAIVGNYEIKRRHELMTTAKALREAVGWIQTLVTPQASPQNGEAQLVP